MSVQDRYRWAHRMDGCWWDMHNLGTLFRNELITPINFILNTIFWGVSMQFHVILFKDRRLLLRNKNAIWLDSSDVKTLINSSIRWITTYYTAWTIFISRITRMMFSLITWHYWLIVWNFHSLLWALETCCILWDVGFPQSLLLELIAIHHRLFRKLLLELLTLFIILRLI